MKTYTNEKLKEILKLHKAWLLCGKGQRADLQGVDLQGACLQDADLRGACLRGAYNLDYPIACPEEGSFIGFKKLRNNLIAKLEIPKDAKRLSATGRKCRASKAIVLEIKDSVGKTYEQGFSQRSLDFIYTVDKTVDPEKPFEEDRWNECSSGIHFFITRQEAINC